jgi:hypothetical protein
MNNDETAIYEALVRKHGFELGDRIWFTILRFNGGKPVTPVAIARIEDYVLSRIERF